MTHVHYSGSPRTTIASRLTRLAIGAMAAVAAIAATLAVSAPSASARTLAQARAICPDGAVCLFDGFNWDGKYVAARYGISDLNDFEFNDRASSYLNDSSSQDFCLSENSDSIWHSLGARISVVHGHHSMNMSPTGWSNRVSSIQRVGIFGC
jgi:Peptidase inhibitor family I36